jgi:hypothetical protein
MDQVRDMDIVAIVDYPRLDKHLLIGCWKWCPTVATQRHVKTFLQLAMHPTIKQIVSRGPSTNVTVKGWIRSIRRQKNVQFAEVVDGSSLRGIQAILSPDQATEYAP